MRKSQVPLGVGRPRHVSAAATEDPGEMFLEAEPRMWAPGTAEEASLISQPPVLFRAVSEALSAHPGVPGATGVDRES